jgi:tetratricopeptide (TPR) repeat protein
MTGRLLALSLRHAGRYPEALAQARNTLGVFRRLGNPARTAEMACAAAELHAHLGRPARAKPLFLEALERAGEESLDALSCDAQTGLGQLALLDRGLAEAERRFKAAVTAARRGRLPYCEIAARAGLAQLAAARGKPSAARRALDRLVAQALSIQEPALAGELRAMRKTLGAGDFRASA